MLEYEEFYRLYTQYPWSSDFLKVRKAVGSKEFNIATEYIRNNCCLGNYRIYPEDVQVFAENILEYAFENDAAELCKDMQFWYAFAGILNYDLVELMAKKRVSVLCDPEVLDAAIDADNFWWVLENLEFVYEGCKRYCDENKDQQAITKYTLRLLKDQIAEVKKSIKADEKKRKNEGHSDGSNPLLNMIQGLRNIGKHPEHDEQEFDMFYEEVPEKPKKEKHSNINNKKRK